MFENKLRQLHFNTLTIYFAPFFFDQPKDFFISSDFRIVVADEFFDQKGYLRADVNIKQILSKIFLISEITNLTNLEDMLRNMADLFFSYDRYIVLKMQPFRMELSPSYLTDMQNIINLKTSALSRFAKKKIQQFWRDIEEPNILLRVSEELYPTDNVKIRLAEKLGIDFSLLQNMQDITEAIKWNTDGFSPVLKYLDIKFEKKAF